jgi:hypothetical protein
MLTSMEAFLAQSQEVADKRMRMQLGDVCSAIRQVLEQLAGGRQE